MEGVLELLSDRLEAGDELGGETGQLLISRETILAVTAIFPQQPAELSSLGA